MNLRLPLLVLVAAAVTAAGMGVVAILPGEEVRPRLSASSATAGPVGASASVGLRPTMAGLERSAAARALALLRAWDARRARAWARGDVAGLRALYRPRSRAGVHDRRMLARWQARGLRVVGMRTQVLAVHRAEVSRDRVVVVVTERLVGARAVGRGRPVTLPTGHPSTRRIELRRGPAGWVVVSVCNRVATRVGSGLATAAPR